MKSSIGQLHPARIRAIQNIQRQFPSEEVYPAIIGPMSGAKLFTSPEAITALPRCNRFGYKSEYIPPRMYCGADAPMPFSSRKTNSVGQFGASAHPRVESV